MCCVLETRFSSVVLCDARRGTQVGLFGELSGSETGGRLSWEHLLEPQLDSPVFLRPVLIGLPMWKGLYDLPAADRLDCPFPRLADILNVRKCVD